MARECTERPHGVVPREDGAGGGRVGGEEELADALLGLVEERLPLGRVLHRRGICVPTKTVSAVTAPRHAISLHSINALKKNERNR